MSLDPITRFIKQNPQFNLYRTSNGLRISDENIITTNEEVFINVGDSEQCYFCHEYIVSWIEVYVDEDWHNACDKCV